MEMHAGCRIASPPANGKSCRSGNRSGSRQGVWGNFNDISRITSATTRHPCDAESLARDARRRAAVAGEAVSSQPSGQGFQGVTLSKYPHANDLRLSCGFLVVPAGTPDNSPPIHRWVHEPLAANSPGRGDRNPHPGTAPHSYHQSLSSVVPGGTRLLVGIAVPPLKRWAIVESPYRDKIK